MTGTEKVVNILKNAEEKIKRYPNKIKTILVETAQRINAETEKRFQDYIVESRNGNVELALAIAKDEMSMERKKDEFFNIHQEV